LTGYQVRMKIFLSIPEIVKMKVKLVNYFLVCSNVVSCNLKSKKLVIQTNNLIVKVLSLNSFLCKTLESYHFSTP
jgi:hypothetical protein